MAGRFEFDDKIKAFVSNKLNKLIPTRQEKLMGYVPTVKAGDQPELNLSQKFWTSPIGDALVRTQKFMESPTSRINLPRFNVDTSTPFFSDPFKGPKIAGNYALSGIETAITEPFKIGADIGRAAATLGDFKPGSYSVRLGQKAATLDPTQANFGDVKELAALTGGALSSPFAARGLLQPNPATIGGNIALSGLLGGQEAAVQAAEKAAPMSGFLSTTGPLLDKIAGGRFLLRTALKSGANVLEGLALDKVIDSETTPLSVAIDALVPVGVEIAGPTKNALFAGLNKIYREKPSQWFKGAKSLENLGQNIVKVVGSDGVTRYRDTKANRWIKKADALKLLPEKPMQLVQTAPGRFTNKQNLKDLAEGTLTGGAKDNQIAQFLKNNPQMAAGGLAGVEPQFDEDGNFTGMKFNPQKATAGVIVAGGVKSIDDTRKVPIGDTTSKYNIGKLGGNEKILKQGVSDVAERFNKVAGKSLSFDEVIKAAEDTKAVLETELGRDQVKELGAAQLRLRQNISKLATADKVTPELIDAINKDASFARGIAQLLGQRNIDVKDLPVEDKLKVNLIKSVLKVSDDIEAISKEAENVDFSKNDDVVKFYRKFVTPKLPEIVDELRYNNMLSNPKTYLRNLYSNAFQAGITRPGTLLFSGKPKEAIQYYSGSVKSLPDAVEAFRKSYSGSITGKPDLPNISTGKLPKFLTVPTRALEATDKFFSTIIQGGELARGASAKEAEDIAEYSLFRGDLKPEGQGKLLNAIDNVTNWTYKAPKAVRWFVPFIKTPMNVAKQWIEYSPAGVATLPGSKNQREQIAKTLFGSTMMALGAKFAADGNTTWSAPTDQKEKEAFYASGKKPFSVRIGDRWVPMMYFGPFALALGTPAAFKYYQEDDRKALSDSEIDKAVTAVSSLAQLLSGQTFLEGLDQFVKLASGDLDYSLPGNLAFTSGQIIPYQGLLRYVSSIVDPIYRKPEGNSFTEKFTQSLQKDIPFLSKNLKPYTTPLGEPSKRLPENYVLPYDLGKQDNTFEPALQSRRSELQTNAVRNKAIKILENGKSDNMKGVIQTSSNGVKYALIDNKISYVDSSGTHTLDMDIPEAPKMTGNVSLDRKLKSSYSSKITSRINNITKLYEAGILTSGQAEQLINALEAEKARISGSGGGLRSAITGNKISLSAGNVGAARVPGFGGTSTARIQLPQTQFKPVKLGGGRLSTGQLPGPAKINLEALRNPKI